MVFLLIFTGFFCSEGIRMETPESFCLCILICYGLWCCCCRFSCFFHFKLIYSAIHKHAWVFNDILSLVRLYISFQFASFAWNWVCYILFSFHSLNSHIQFGAEKYVLSVCVCLGSGFNKRISNSYDLNWSHLVFISFSCSSSRSHSLISIAHWVAIVEIE